jgi:hypothetical protein
VERHAGERRDLPLACAVWRPCPVARRLRTHFSSRHGNIQQVVRVTWTMATTMMTMTPTTMSGR